MFIYYSIHYPKPDMEALLVENMHEYSAVMAKQSGIVFVAPYPFKDKERGILLGISIWESE
jgi:hypothetical protein